MNTNSSPKPHSHAAGSHHGLNRRDFVRLAATGTGLAVTQLAARGIGAPTTPTGPGAIRFALIGDFGETLADQTFPVDRVGALIRSWNPDFVVTSGDNNYVLGEAATIDVNVGKNFTGFIYPKSTTIPTQYPYPPGSPAYNRFIPCLGNHDYGDVADDALPSLDNVAKNAGYQQYLRNALRQGTALAPNTTITFADNAVGQTWTHSLTGKVEDFAPFQESENLRFYDVRLGTASGPSSVHLFILDSDSPTPYGRYSADRAIPNRDGTPSQYTEKATQAAWLKQRLAASTELHGPVANISLEKKALVDKVHDALFASKIISYAQGLGLIKTMGEKKNWGLDLGSIAAIWRGGCIIRARFLNRITDAYRGNPGLTNLMLDPFFKDLLNKFQQSWRETVALAVTNGIPVPAFSASLGYYDSYRAARLPANLLQAQRDFFGAHTYERLDKPEGKPFHTEWPDVVEDEA